MNDETILVVDDNPENLTLMELLLACDNFDVQTASSAVEALQALVFRVPDALLTDIQMPDMDGLELIRRVREDRRACEILILAVSANAMKENIEQAYAAGCDGYITKPLDTRTFAALVREQLSRGRSRETRSLAKPKTSEERIFLHGDFFANCIRQIGQLAECTPEVPWREQACYLLHQCAGTAGVLGYPQIASSARDLIGLSDVLNEEELRDGLDKLSDLLTHVQLQAGAPAK